MADAKEWRRQLNNWGKKTVTVIEDVVVEATREMRRRVAGRTPVRTGRAAASWNASIGSPDFNAQPETYLNPKGAVDDGKENLDGYQLGQNTYVANGVPYIGSLNNGSSAKAPAGFVETTALEVNAMLPSIVEKVKRKHGI